ncbi:MAG: TetR/AcrR family transcriptional regulator [Phenylobacterium sp.]|uniref:TetR/AcrR family transcriptional regulator n=1 Tax=Phenylobacterium sp. TaxID=1871053 RepID=UPI001A5EDD31|nr:TetR/AcrR family transcriptional regulator [Phenylobacterium sp.]MBL8772372.1 TetR/AcrR family transcriptional regulator [Phenylobacterium sp.]
MRDESGAVTLSRREAGKEERRRRIIRAARDLIRETGNTGLSMRALAARAGVSLATPYNLFGSKRAILLSVLDDIREYLDRFADLRSTEPLERLFGALDICVDFYVADPAFYRTVWAALFDPSDDFRSQIFNSQRFAFWESLVRDVARAGAIAEDVDVELLSRSLDRSFGAAMLDWVTGDLSNGQLGPTIRYGYALALRGAASPPWAGALDARVRESQAAIRAAAAG